MTEFITAPLLRGFNEIKPLFELCEKHGGTICGGYARYCASPKPTNQVKPAGDVDMFPNTEQATNAIHDALLAMGFEDVHENHVCITMKAEKGRDELAYMPQPQIIKPIIEGKIVALGTIDEILENFDFTVVRAAILTPTEVLVDPNFLEDEKYGKLCLRNIHCPISSLLRCCKYVRKGYFLRPAEALKLFMDWTDRGEEYQQRIIALFLESAKGEKSDKNPNGMTQEEIDELEALLRID